MGNTTETAFVLVHKGNLTNDQICDELQDYGLVVTDRAEPNSFISFSIRANRWAASSRAVWNSIAITFVPSPH
jgi:hypothetical protein